MKQVKDALLHVARSVCGYVLFYALLRLYEDVRGVSFWVYLPAVIIGLELLNLAVGRLLKRLFGFDPLFVYQMPLLVYAMYRMGLELIFLIFLFAVLGFSPWLVVFVGLIYIFGLLRHSIRLHRMMIEGRRPESASP